MSLWHFPKTRILISVTHDLNYRILIDRRRSDVCRKTVAIGCACRSLFIPKNSPLKTANAKLALRYASPPANVNKSPTSIIQRIRTCFRGSARELFELVSIYFKNEHHTQSRTYSAALAGWSFIAATWQLPRVLFDSLHVKPILSGWREHKLPMRLEIQQRRRNRNTFLANQCQSKQPDSCKEF